MPTNEAHGPPCRHFAAPLNKVREEFVVGLDMESAAHIASPDTQALLVLDAVWSQALQTHEFLSFCGNTRINNLIT